MKLIELSQGILTGGFAIFGIAHFFFYNNWLKTIKRESRRLFDYLGRPEYFSFVTRIPAKKTIKSSPDSKYRQLITPKIEKAEMMMLVTGRLCMICFWTVTLIFIFQELSDA